MGEILDAGWAQWSLVDEADESTTYFGFTDHDQPDSNPKCAILRVQKTDSVTTRMWAAGDMIRNKDWDDRASLTYKFLV